MAVYDFATTFTDFLQQKYAKELCSDALTQSNQQVKFINAQTIKLPRMTVSGYKDHTRTPGFNMGTLSNDWEAKRLEHDRDVEFWVDPMDIDETKTRLKVLKYRFFQTCFCMCGIVTVLNYQDPVSVRFACWGIDGSMY